MNETHTRLEDRAAELRHAFDRSFAEAPRQGAEPTEDLLAIRLGGNPHAVRLTEIAGLLADRRVTPVPSALPELVGIVAHRGTLLPVYDLSRLLGYSTPTVARWLVVAANAPVALAFDDFEGHQRVPRDVLTGMGARIVQLAPIVETIARLAREARTRNKER